MLVELVKEHEDGSATFTFDMSPDETRWMVVFGIRRALEEAVARGEEWHDSEVQSKPVVEYKNFDGLQQWPGEDFCFVAQLGHVLNHPRLGYQHIVRTSKLVTLPDENGSFETLNTKYVRVKDE